MGLIWKNKKTKIWLIVTAVLLVLGIAVNAVLLSVGIHGGGNCRGKPLDDIQTESQENILCALIIIILAGIA